MEVIFKACTVCEFIKPQSEFYGNSSTSDKLMTECKECFKARRKDYYQRNKTAEILYAVEYTLNHYDKHLASQRKYSQKRPNRKGLKVPTWLTKDDEQRILAIYQESKRLTQETGIKHEVDHIWSVATGGIHHPDNLRVITMSENRRRSLQERRVRNSIKLVA